MTEELLDALATLNENMEKNNQLLSGISNLIEENPSLDKFAQELHKLSTSIGQIGKLASSEISKSSMPTAETDDRGRPLVKPQWVKCETQGDWICKLPNNGTKTQCKKCGNDIVWTVTKNNKRMPISEDPQRPSWYVSHFDSCKPDRPSPAPAKSDEDMDIPF